ncbi:MAG: glycosyltransferase family 4 protein [Bdellovibrionaceae bacterium]|nr:glycosyltransferase family 4 protein [Pseudobdellovibrionaceae bacterium]
MKQPTLVICFSNNNGGMELNSIEMAKLLTQNGKVYMACRSKSFIESQQDSLKKHNVELLSIPFKGNLSWTCITQLRRFIKTHSIKNILFFGASELKSIVLGARGLNVNILNFHGTTKTHNKNNFLHRWIYKSVNHHIAVSEHIKRNVLKIIPGTTNANTHVIYLPYKHSPQPVKSLTRPIEIINVARITPGKGHEAAVYVMEQLIDQKYDVKLTFVGSTEDQKLYGNLSYKIRSRAELAQRIIFAGFTQRVSDFLKKSHVMLFPSQGEGLPNVIIEAFFHKVLPVSYDNTVFPEFVKMGFYFPLAKDNNASSLLQCTKEILDLSDENYIKHTERNFELAESLFSTSVILKKYRELLI